MKYVTKALVFFSLTVLMFVLSIEAIKASRDQLRLVNAKSLSKSIQHYYLLNGAYPVSTVNNNVSDFLYTEKLLTKAVRDPAYTSATLSMSHYYFMIANIYNKNLLTLSNFDSQEIKGMIKRKLNYYLNLDNNTNITTADSSNNHRKQVLNNWPDESTPSDITIHEKNNKYGETNTKFDSNGIPLECVIAYKSDNQTNSYEISVYLESRFFKEKMKWDGGNDSSRFEVGNDLRLNTELVVTDAGINVLSENVSIIK